MGIARCPLSGNERIEADVSGFERIRAVRRGGEDMALRTTHGVAQGLADERSFAEHVLALTLIVDVSFATLAQLTTRLCLTLS
jgi:hypothetical protein